MYGHERLLNKMKAKLLSLFVVACLLPTLTLAGQRSEPRSLYQRPDGEWFLCKGRSAISRSRHQPGRRCRSGSNTSAGIAVRIGDERKRTDGKARSAGERRLDAWTLIGPNAVADRCARLTGQTPS